MFGWFKSKACCPVSDDARRWIDFRWDWLEREFGLERLRNGRLILPSPEFFPDPFDGTDEAIAQIFGRVCAYMSVDPSTVEMHFYKDRPPVYEGEWQHATAGLYEAADGRFRIWVEIGNLNDPLALVATLAHELGHVHLLGHGRISSDTDDHEPLTDLLTVYLGLGVFTANSVLRERNSSNAFGSSWSVGRRGYLGMREYGYALARYARARSEIRPKWIRDLRLDVRSAFKQATQFLNENEAGAVH